MPITSTHPEYDARIKQWERCRDCADGSDAVKGKGTRYLPRLREQDENDYNAYVMRALFYGATGRTIQGLVGAVFRKDPTIVVQNRYEEISLDVTNSGQSISDFARKVQEEGLTLGRVGLLVDAAEGEANRAYVSMYTAEAITNWKTERIEGEVKLTRVVLIESYTEPNPNDPYQPKASIQYRELYLDDNGKYAVNIWRKRDGQQDSDQYEIVETLEPDRSGIRMKLIPFVFLNAYSTDAETEKPPLLDLVDVNLSHYRSSADLEHGAHFTALPTPYVGGFAQDSELYLGSSKAWVSSSDQIKVGFLEYTGQGLQAIMDQMERKENLMAVLGGRLLEAQKRGVEAAETHKIRRSGEEGSLLTMVSTSSEAFTQVLQWLIWWSGADEAASKQATVELNRDFVNTQIDPAYMESLMKARQTGEISQETFLYNLQRGEVFEPGRTVEDEQQAIEDDLGNDLGNTGFGSNVAAFRNAGGQTE